MLSGYGHDSASRSLNCVGARARPIRSLQRILLVAMLIGQSACSEQVTSPVPANAVRFVVPPVYSTWWLMVESCSGLNGSLSDVDWYVIPNATSIPTVGEFVGGYWDPSGNKIVLIGEVQEVGSTVRHEMLHALLQKAGHPRAYFLERCGGVVQCTSECIEDAGPPPSIPVGTPIVSPDLLEVSVAISPAAPRRDTQGGYFTVIVSARNPAKHAVVVTDSLSDQQFPSTTFGYIFGATGPGLGFFDSAWDPEVTSFAAGETKREVFDFAVGDAPGAVDLAPGAYTIRGGYDTNVTPPLSFNVR
jgi:hypothetical protein